jgi:MYXO-CTERM domain-containing protein
MSQIGPYPPASTWANSIMGHRAMLIVGNPAVAPEPAAWGLAGLGVVAFWGIRRRSRQRFDAVRG